MKQTKSHQCKCHLKSESAIINSTATKCSVVSYISSCFVRMTANALITIACRDLLINKSQLLSWQSAEHKALLAVGKPQQMLCVHHASITRSLSAHPWRSTWPHSCATHVWLKFHSCTGVVVPGVSFWWFMSLAGVAMTKHGVLVGRHCWGCSPATRVWQAPSGSLAKGHSSACSWGGSKSRDL